MGIAVVLLASGAIAIAGGPPHAGRDWLVGGIEERASARAEGGGARIVLENGLVRRTFATRPNFATIGLENLSGGASVIRGVKPEARVRIDGVWRDVGGLTGQPDYAYLDPEWIEDLRADPNAFRFEGHEIGTPEAPYPWVRKRHAPDAAWPPRGAALRARFAAPAGEPALRGVTIEVRYEIYDGIPVVAKSVAVANGSDREIVVDGLEAEILAVTEGEKPRVHAESDFAFDGMETTSWDPDPQYTSQIDYRYRMPILLVSRYPLGPGARLGPGDRFESFRTFLLLHDGDDRERRGLARRRMMRVLAPQAMENPILMHVRSSDRESVRRAIDQASDVGFEMVILTFWSGFDIESRDSAYIARFREDAEYARAKGIELGGYTLMCASRDVGPAFNCIDPATGKPGSKFGQSACLASAWGDGYVRRVLDFIDATGMSVIETDGPYHGDVCASTVHAHHAGLADSQVAQWRACRAFYGELRRRGVYVNSPDRYYLAGSNKCAMGYRESNWSLPRERQTLIARQNIYDGTWEKTPSMGWMFVPLVEYHGGGAAATLEPLREHLADYEWHLAQNFGSGVMACYRGPRLYDAPETRALVAKWVDFYKRYRRILDADVIHVRRADGRDIDCMMHVDPAGPVKALAMVYNPTGGERRTEIELPLYYAGLTETARVREREGDAKEFQLDRGYRIRVPLAIGPRAITYLVIE
ncbi:MAG: alpha-galactosidase [Planctomycetes bacterium]|nr:alpha-galactosidase [Planctomycetota bacterium]